MKNYYKIFILFMLLCGVGMQYGIAQDGPSGDPDYLSGFIPQSPNADGLAQYGEVPVGLYTGVPSINVPLVTTKAIDAAMPLSLSYHASGIKVAQISSNVGLGWSLNAGGVITREVRDQPDDAYQLNVPIMPFCWNSPGNPYTCDGDVCAACEDCSECTSCNGCLMLLPHFPYQNIGYLHNQSTLQPLLAQDVGDYDEAGRAYLYGDMLYDQQIVTGPSPQPYLDDPETFVLDQLDWDYLVSSPQLEVHDSEPDIFSFNFNGISGQFVFDQYGAPKLLSDTDLRITYELTDDVNFPSNLHPGITSYDPFDGTGAFSSVFGGGITKFTITTPDGTQYVFEEKELSMANSNGQQMDINNIQECNPPLRSEYKVDFSHTRAAVNAWYLSKIVNNIGQQEYAFNYVKEITMDHGGMSETKSTSCNGDVSRRVSSSVSTVLGKRLVSIQYGDLDNGINYGSVEFVYNGYKEDLFYPTELWDFVPQASYDRAKKLSKIIWNGANGSALKDFDLSYDLFSESINLGGCEPWVQAHGKRIKLTSIVENGLSDGNQVSMPPYTFQYDNTALPPRHSPQIDFWGYYNANGANTLLPKILAYPYDMDNSPLDNQSQDYNGHIDLFQSIYSIYDRMPASTMVSVNGSGANRRANPDAVTAAMLTSITYPTGATATLEYESNEFRVDKLRERRAVNELSQNIFGGGVRIKRFDTNEGMEKVYDYNLAATDNFYITSGKVIDLPNFAQCNTTNCGGSEPTGVSLVDSKTTISSSSIYELHTTLGSYVGYEKVTEKFEGRGKTVNNFDIPGDFGTISDPPNCSGSSCYYERPTVASNQIHIFPDNYPFPAKPNYDWNRGSLLTQFVYDESDELVQKTENVYTIMSPERIYGLHVRSSHIIFPTEVTFPNDPIVYFTDAGEKSAGKYYILSGDKRLSETYVTDYLEGGGTVESESLICYSASHHMPICKTTTNGGVTQIEQTKYVPDAGDVDGISAWVLAWMQEKYMIGIPIVTTTSGEINSGSKTIYQNFGTYNDKVLRPASFHRKLQDGSWELLGEITDYNDHGLPLTYDKANYNDDITFTWQDAQLASKNYIDWHWNYAYHPNSRLLTSNTAIDGQTTTFEYDGLLRLKESEARSGNLRSEYQYGFKSQGADHNHITVDNIFSDIDDLSTTKYFDKLGRYQSTIRNGYGPGGEDVMTHGIIRNSAGQTILENNYQPGWNLHAYDNSILDRKVNRIFSDGSNSTTNYYANSAGEVPGFPENTLYKIKVTDENGNPTYTYTDILGRQHMIKNAEGGNTLSTYDGFGNVATVTTPEGQLYEYTYDNFHRLATKAIPSAGTTTLSYNNRHLKTGSLDAEGNQLNFTYDDYDRNTIISLAGQGTMILNKYDSYSGVPSTHAPSSSGGALTGKLTATRTRILDGTGNFLWAANHYDGFGRINKIVEDNPFGGIDEQEMDLNHADLSELVTQIHTGPRELSILSARTYDHGHRQIADRHSVANGTGGVGLYTTLSNSFYNTKDLVATKKLAKLGSLSGGNFLQEINYKYNVRSWLTDINTIDDSYGLAINSCTDPEIVPCEPKLLCLDQEVKLKELLARRALSSDISLECYEACELPKQKCDYTVSFGEVDFVQLVSITAGGQNLSLPGLPYDQAQRWQDLKADLEQYMTANNIPFAGVGIVENGRYTDIVIRQTTLEFNSIRGLNRGSYTEEVFVKSNCEQRTNSSDGTNTASGNSSNTTIGTVGTGGDGIPGDGNNDCWTDINQKASNVGSSVLFSTYFGETPYADLTVENSGATNSLVDDNVSWEILRDGYPRNQYAEAEWNINFNLPTGATLGTYKALIDVTNILLTEGGFVRLGLFDGNSVVQINGGQDFIYVSNAGIVTLIPDQLPSVAQMSNMQLGIMYNEGRMIHIDAVSVNIEYTVCENDKCSLPDLTCTEKEKLAQQQSIDILRVAMAALTIDDVRIPSKLNRVRFCDGTEMYVLDQELSIIVGDYVILQSVDIISVDDIFQISNTPKTSTDTPPPPTTTTPDDIFALKLYYQKGNKSLMAPSQYNGNISHLKWKIAGRTTKAYGYKYDEVDRLINAKFGEYIQDPVNGDCGITDDNKYSVSGLSYDLDGNILSLSRNGLLNADCVNDPTANVFGPIDVLSYQYGNGDNLLTGLTDAVANQGGVNKTSSTMTYDDNGNMITNTEKDISNIQYNFLNLPTMISFNSGSTLEFVYDASGRKLSKTITENGNISIKHYFNGIEYIEETGTTELRSVVHNEGRVVPKGNLFRYEFSLRDHLGNSRVTFSDFNLDGEITIKDDLSTPNDNESELIQENHYYPFGMNMKGQWTFTEAKATDFYQYNGKELNDDFGLNWNDYGARWYDAAVGRWTSVDDLAEHPNQIDKSPFAYAWNNPIRYDDPDGNCPECVLKNVQEGFRRIFHTAATKLDNFKAEVYAKGGQVLTKIKLAFGSNETRIETQVTGKAELNSAQLFERNSSNEVHLSKPVFDFSLKTDTKLVNETKIKTNIEGVDVEFSHKIETQDGATTVKDKVSAGKNSDNAGASLYVERSQNADETTTTKTGVQAKVKVTPTPNSFFEMGTKVYYQDDGS